MTRTQLFWFTAQLLKVKLCSTSSDYITYIYNTILYIVYIYICHPKQYVVTISVGIYFSNIFHVFLGTLMSHISMVVP